MEQDMEYYRRYLKGDADALGELMKLYRERLIFFAMEFLSSPDDAEEVAAECFAELAPIPCDTGLEARSKPISSPLPGTKL